MLPTFKRALAFTVFLGLTTVQAYGQAVVDSNLTAALQQAGSSDTLSVIVTYNSAPTSSDINFLKGIGVGYGVVMQALPMAGVWATPSQVQRIIAQNDVRSVYLNSTLSYFNKEGTAITGATKQRTMPGYGYSGKGVGVAVVDSGIDATHPDLPMGTHVVQNVKVPIGGNSLGSPFAGVVPPVYQENLADTDTSSGHGTHCAGTVAGLGTQSGGDFAGVAPGANLIGVSTGETLVILWALEGFDYVLTHRYLYNIKVVSNSWGTTGPFNADDPVNVASKVLHDNGITVCFAAGNAGPGANTINPYSVAPWVISVAAGDKQGRLASFSSRGILNDAVYHPTVTAPGVSIVSCRSKDSVLGALGAQQDAATLTPAQLPYYTHMDGTSMATPNVAGSCALMLQANPALAPDDIKRIFQQTATPISGQKQYEVGAGYLNVLASLHVATSAVNGYGTVLNQTYNAKFSGSQTVNTWTQAFDPSGAPPVYNYNVGTNGQQSDIYISWDNSANTLNLAVTSPSGSTTSTGSNLLAAVYGSDQSVAIANPGSGTWHTTVYGLKGQSTGTTGVGVPDTIHGSVTNYYGTFSGLNDIAGSPYAPYIRRAVSMRLMDSYPDGTFRPTVNVNRADAAKIIASDCEIRQNLLTANPFKDISGALATYVQAVTATGAPIRDIFLQAAPVMTGATATTFNPYGTVARADLAIWLVKALGLDAAAQSNMQTPTGFSDDASIPAYARGYVVEAINIGLMPGYTNPTTVEGSPNTYSWKPTATVTRGGMAVIIGKWYDIFQQ